MTESWRAQPTPKPQGYIQIVSPVESNFKILMASITAQQSKK
ncbi:10481_t:CDS:2, partial [Rhizophagus irregularis]